MEDLGDAPSLSAPPPPHTLAKKQIFRYIVIGPHVMEWGKQNPTVGLDYLPKNTSSTSSLDELTKCGLFGEVEGQGMGEWEMAYTFDLVIEGCERMPAAPG